MRYIILFCISVIFTGCTEVQSKENGVNYCAGCKTQEYGNCQYIAGCSTQKYDKCQYIICKFGASEVSIIHKGDCDNPIHK
jgi:hypothetical protein